jgi:hypothetical protein
MTVIDLFSKRKRRSLAAAPDPFTYDSLPIALRVQIVHIWRDALGIPDEYMSRTNKVYEEMNQMLAREFGVFSLKRGPYETDFEAVSNYLLKTDDTDRALDIIELSFKFIVAYGSDDYFRNISRCTSTPLQAIDELNQRFLQHAVGYELTQGQLLRKDNAILHKEVVLPALTLLNQKAFAGPNQEFLLAHEHYRRGRYKESLNECLKAFESTMKAICKLKKWKYSEKDTAKALIDVCLSNQLIPIFLQSEFSSLRAALEGGIPTVRNRLSGHGQGPEPIDVPAYYASYLLNLTAATIVLLVNAYEAS